MFLMAMVGLSNVSGAALQDKTAALAAAQEEVQRLAATAERERIGRDLHDLLGRTLTLVTIKAELAAKLATRDPAKAEAEMREVAQASREALAEVRAAVSGMTGTGFAREVEQSCTALEAAGITCTVEGAPERVDGGTGAVLAMALREAVTNVIRHSGARQCRIRIHRQGRSVELGVEDDGDGTAVREAGGIGGIRARLAAAGGSLSVEGSHSGTHLRATLPLAT
jgi:two-component system sensor histidine kinase DesK